MKGVRFGGGGGVVHWGMETVKGWQRGSRVSRRSSGIIGDCMTDVNNITIDIIMGTAQVKAKTKNTKSLI